MLNRDRGFETHSYVTEFSVPSVCAVLCIVMDSCHVANTFIVNSNPRKDKKKTFRCALILMFHVHSKFRCCLKNPYI